MFGFAAGFERGFFRREHAEDFIEVRDALHALSGGYDEAESDLGDFIGNTGRDVLDIFEDFADDYNPPYYDHDYQGYWQD